MPSASCGISQPGSGGSGFRLNWDGGAFVHTFKGLLPKKGSPYCRGCIRKKLLCNLGGGSKYFLVFTPTWGRFPF